jgi:SPP1 family predicted phage head-tail adaptor
MSDAGDYDTLFTWLKQSEDADIVGQEIETFTPNGTLWGALKYGSGSKNKDFESDQTGVTATIRIHNYPDLSALDRFSVGDETFLIETIVPGDDELVCECIRYDTLEL